MTNNEAFIILGNIPIPVDDECYDICQYQEAKAIALDAVSKQEEQEVTHESSIYSKYTCPRCKNVIEEWIQIKCHQHLVIPNYCKFCGQKLKKS